ncbi:hypothetical protein [Salinadaptatus halalkaliphilus]|nr:hypothetical protein [Salinadaptatus halalkaliphilus]
MTGDLTAEERSMVREYPQRSPVYNLVTLEHRNRPNVEIDAPA